MHADRPTLPEATRDGLVRAGRLDDPTSARLILESLDADEPRLRVLALRAGDRRALMSPVAWHRALDDVSPDVRREALDLLAGSSGDDSLDEAIITSLSDHEPLVVEAAAFALGERQCHRAVASLVETATTHPDPRCREAAVAALGSLGDDGGRAAVIAALDDKPPVRRRAVVALANFDGEDVEAALARAVEDRDWQVRAAADQLTREDETDD